MTKQHFIMKHWASQKQSSLWDAFIKLPSVFPYFVNGHTYIAKLLFVLTTNLFGPLNLKTLLRITSHLTSVLLTVLYYFLVECRLVDSTLRLWHFTLHLLPLRLNNKIFPVRAMGTFLIIAAIIIMLVLQRSLSGLCGPTASWMGTQRENGNQHPGFINLLVAGVQQKSLFTHFKGGCNQKQHLSIFPS